MFCRGVVDEFIATATDLTKEDGRPLSGFCAKLSAQSQQKVGERDKKCKKNHLNLPSFPSFPSFRWFVLVSPQGFFGALYKGTGATVLATSVMGFTSFGLNEFFRRQNRFLCLLQVCFVVILFLRFLFLT